MAHVQVEKNRRWFKGTQTLFIAEDVVDVSVSWKGPAAMEIVCNGCPSLASDAIEWGDVVVSLRQPGKTEPPSERGEAVEHLSGPLVSTVHTSVVRPQRGR